jgi:hypothetical protein
MDMAGNGYGLSQSDMLKIQIAKGFRKRERGK